MRLWSYLNFPSWLAFSDTAHPGGVLGDFISFLPGEGRRPDFALGLGGHLGWKGCSSLLLRGWESQLPLGRHWPFGWGTLLAWGTESPGSLPGHLWRHPGIECPIEVSRGWKPVLPSRLSLDWVEVDPLFFLWSLGWVEQSVFKSFLSYQAISLKIFLLKEMGFYCSFICISWYSLAASFFCCTSRYVKQNEISGKIKFAMVPAGFISSLNLRYNVR